MGPVEIASKPQPGQAPSLWLLIFLFIVPPALIVCALAGVVFVTIR